MRRSRPGAAGGTAPCWAAAALLGVLPAQTPATGPDRGLRFETGRVTVKGDVATIDLPPGWRYLQQDEARFVVERVWRNQPNPRTLGLVLPGPNEEWGGIVVSYLAHGHVDVQHPDLDEERLLALLREEMAASNLVRRRAGIATGELLGWADPPHFDSVAKALRWGKLVRVAGRAEPTVNYEGRVLGAEGTLVLQAVASATDLVLVRTAMRLILGRIELAPELHYGEFDPARHTRSDLELADLVAPPVAEVSMFRIVLKPLIALAVVALALLADRSGRRAV